MVVLAASLALVSCVHECPEDPAVDPTIIEASIRLLPSGPLTVYPNGEELVETSTSNANLAARYYVELYASNTENFSIDKGELVWADTLLREPSEIEEPVNLNLELNALHYKMVVWQDLVDAENTDTDLFWSVPSLNGIAALPKDGYYACNDNKMAQTATYEFDLTPYFRKWDIKESIDIQLCSAVSKFVIVADDVAEFIKSYRANYDVEPDVSVEEIISSCTFKVSYMGYMLNGYNAFRDKMNNSEGGYAFATEPVVIDKGHACICFDYMLTNADTRVTLKLDTYDRDGYLINSISNIEVPLSRGCVTVVHGNYLTRDYGGGIGIDPGFEGEINVQI